MKTVCKKLLSLMLVAVLLVSAVPFQVFAAEVEPAADSTEATAAATTEATVAATEAAVVSEVPETTAAATEPVVAAETEAPAEAAKAVKEEPASAAQPAVAAVGDTRNVYFVVDGHGFAQTTVQIGSKLNYVPSNYEVLEAYADYHGNYTGKQFSGWTINNFGSFNPTTTNIIDSMVDTNTGNIYIHAVITDQTQSIVLITNGGNLSSVYYNVKIGQPYGNLPTPTRDNYTFKGWYKNGTKVTSKTIVTDASNLTAEWTLDKYTVQFQRYDISSGEWVDGYNCASVSALGTVSVTGTSSGFPSSAQIAKYYDLDGYSIVGWEIAGTDTAFTADYTQVSKDLVIRPRYQRTITLLANNPNNYTSNSTKTITVEIGEPIPSLPNPGARDGYTFVDWAYLVNNEYTTISTKANLSNVSAHPNYYPIMGGTFYARWTESTVVYLYIHTNGNTQTATKIVPYYEAPSSGKFDMNLINMYSIFSSYGDYDDDNDYAYGWYDATQWKNYCANTAANAATVYYDIAANGYIEFHIMLINNGGTSSSTTNNYNTNSSTADPSNPTTGDYIFMAVIVLAVSAAALTLIFILKKRKASK